MLPDCRVGFLLLLVVVHSGNYRVHEEVGRTDKFELLGNVVNKFILSVEIDVLGFLHAPLGDLSDQNVCQDSEA